MNDPVTFYLFHNLDSLAAAYYAGTGRTLKEGGAGQNFAEGRSLAVAGDGWIVLNTSVPWYAGRGRVGKIRTSVGESIHTYQYALSSSNVGGPSDQVPEGGPRWLSEGSADFLNFQALSHAGLVSYKDERASIEPWGFVRHAKYVEGQLSDMETYTGFQGVRGNEYKFSLMAAELLAAHAGQRALLEVYGWLRPGSTWEEAFLKAFGVTVDQFYQMFEAHRAAGFPLFELPIRKPVDPLTQVYKFAPTHAPPPEANGEREPSRGSASARAAKFGLPSNLEWVIGDGVHPEEIEAVMRGAQIMYEFGRYAGLPDVEEPIKVYLHHDFDTIASTYADETGWSVGNSQEFWERRPAPWANAGRGFTFFRLHPPELSPGDSLRRIRDMSAHEFAHTVYQHGLRSLSPADVNYPSRPRWIKEGMAVFYTAMALSHAGVNPYDNQRLYSLQKELEVYRPLSEIESWPDWSERDAITCIYQCGFLAVELLAAHVGIQPLGNYYSEKPAGSTWQESFQAAFGMTVEKFYELFEAHRSAGFPELELPKTRPE